MTREHIPFYNGRYELVGSLTPIYGHPIDVKFNNDFKVSCFNMRYGSPNLPEMVAIGQAIPSGKNTSIFKLYQREPNQYMTGLIPLMKDWYFGDVTGNKKCLLLVHWESRHYISIFVFQDLYPNPRGHIVKTFIQHLTGKRTKEKGPSKDLARNTFDSSVKDGNK
jgi:hypothetical protein